MARSTEEIYQDFLQLSEDERELLLLRLKNEVQGSQANNGWASPEIEQSWMDECDRRVKAIDRGEMAMIPAEEVYRRIRERLAR